MSYVAYKSLLSDIRRQLELHDHQQLLEMCGLDDEAANIHDTRSLMRRLEEKKRFTIDELGDLEEVLESLEEFSLLGKLKKFESKRKEYNDLLEKISGALNDDERNHMEQVINIVKRETSVDFSRENIPSILTLFQKLQKHGSLGFRRLNFVKRILTEIDKEDLVREIEDYEKRRNKKDASERRKAEWYSWGKSFARKVKGGSSLNLVFCTTLF
ncbi:uncharacterized protein LOC111346868 [Stylophora pistillata]|uniref:DED domain-containing protein n=1 Tax=Stylophora pistillata TaxID=50429 RepID=A0A2B4R343_STYPI|nr:uncharacterized protein LOC111346868 [Stylophora pistillata]PFX12764.1 hypothetical protein AWC38_SpisGene23226 [Stylophora pistillata]